MFNATSTNRQVSDTAVFHQNQLKKQQLEIVGNHIQRYGGFIV